MSYLTHLKRTTHCKSCRWIVKRNFNDDIKEIKLVYEPSEYRNLSPRKLYTRDKLIKVLEAEREKKRLIKDA